MNKDELIEKQSKRIKELEEVLDEISSYCPHSAFLSLNCTVSEMKYMSPVSALATFIEWFPWATHMAKTPDGTWTLFSEEPLNFGKESGWSVKKGPIMNINGCKIIFNGEWIDSVVSLRRG